MYLTRDLSKYYRINAHYIHWAPEGPLWVVRELDGRNRVFKDELEAHAYAYFVTKELIRQIAEQETGLELVP